MKTLLIALILMTANAFASEIPVMKIPEARTSGVHSLIMSYGTNTNLGRAWAEVTIVSPFGSDSMDEELRALVPGLSLVGGSIVLDVEGQQVECAKLVTRGIFGYLYPKATGKCIFQVRKSVEQQDNGFEIRKVKMLEIVLVTK